MFLKVSPVLFPGTGREASLFVSWENLEALELYVCCLGIDTAPFHAQRCFLGAMALGHSIWNLKGFDWLGTGPPFPKRSEEASFYSEEVSSQPCSSVPSSEKWGQWLLPVHPCEDRMKTHVGSSQPRLYAQLPSGNKSRRDSPSVFKSSLSFDARAMNQVANYFTAST